jgi:hypothetical protein
MTAFSVAVSLLILFLILDRFQSMILRRRADRDAEKRGNLDVLKIVAKQELYRLGNPDSAVRWITRFLSLMGYTGIKTGKLQEDNSYDFSCLEKEQPVYVVCKLWSVEQFEAPVNRIAVQKLVGAMVGDRVKKGLIITAGELTAEARRYIEGLPMSYRITVIDGIKLMTKLSDLRKSKLEPLTN